MLHTIAAAALLAAVLGGPVPGLASEPEREAGRESRKDEIGKPLAEVAAGKRDPKTLRIEVMWVEGVNRVSASLFGNGVGIWNDRAQIRLSRPDVLSIATALNKAHFGTMPAQLGEETGDKVRLRGKITVSIAGKTKGVVQLASEEESEVLSALASRVLDLVGKRAKTGVTASSLAEALEKLSTGALAPEVLRLTAVRRPEKPDGGRGWLLHLEGRQAVARPFAHGGYGSERRLELSDAEARSLFGALRESNPESLPSSLYASDYVSLKIEALQWSRDLLARRSPNVTPETHGDRQKVFDRLIESLTNLEERAEREGRLDAGRSDGD